MIAINQPMQNMFYTEEDEARLESQKRIWKRVTSFSLTRVRDTAKTSSYLLRLSGSNTVPRRLALTSSGISISFKVPPLLSMHRAKRSTSAAAGMLFPLVRQRGVVTNQVPLDGAALNRSAVLLMDAPGSGNSDQPQRLRSSSANWVDSSLAPRFRGRGQG